MGDFCYFEEKLRPKLGLLTKSSSLEFTKVLNIKFRMLYAPTLLSLAKLLPSYQLIRSKSLLSSLLGVVRKQLRVT